MLLCHLISDNFYEVAVTKIIFYLFVTGRYCKAVKCFKIPIMQNNFLSPLLFILIFVLVLLSIVTICYLYITAKNRERLALIEKGMDPNLSRSDFWIQLGIIIGGIGCGLIVGDYLPGKFGYGPLIAIIFAGAGLVIYNVLRKRGMRSDK